MGRQEGREAKPGPQGQHWIVNLALECIQGMGRSQVKAMLSKPVRGFNSRDCPLPEQLTAKVRRVHPGKAAKGTNVRPTISAPIPAASLTVAANLHALLARPFPAQRAAGVLLLNSPSSGASSCHAVLLPAHKGSGSVIRPSDSADLGVTLNLDQIKSQASAYPGKLQAVLPLFTRPFPGGGVLLDDVQQFRTFSFNAQQLLGCQIALAELVPAPDGALALQGVLLHPDLKSYWKGTAKLHAGVISEYEVQLAKLAEYLNQAGEIEQ